MAQFSPDFQSNLLDLMRRRRNARSFRSDYVDEALRAQGLDTVMLWPSVGLSEPCRVMRINSKDARTPNLNVEAH